MKHNYVILVESMDRFDLLVEVLKNSLKFIFIFFFMVLCCIIFKLVTDKNYYGFPAITQCRVCGKTVWVWQEYERKSFKTDYDFIEFSGLVHSEHEDRPKIKIKVQREK